MKFRFRSTNYIIHVGCCCRTATTRGQVFYTDTVCQTNARSPRFASTIIGRHCETTRQSLLPALRYQSYYDNSHAYAHARWFSKKLFDWTCPLHRETTSYIATRQVFWLYPIDKHLPMSTLPGPQWHIACRQWRGLQLRDSRRFTLRSLFIASIANLCGANILLFARWIKQM